MKAVVIEATGGVDSLQYKEVDAVTPHPNHAIVKNEFAGLNFIDTYHRSGLYPRECPFILGQEGGGVIASLPDDGDRLGFKVGDRVVYGSFGSYAESTSVPIDKLVKVPDDLDMKTAIACMTQGLTAHYLSSSVGAGIAKEGDWVLVYGCGSGTGQWTSQMCKIRGYRVIGVTSKYKVGSNNSDATSASLFGCEKLIIMDNVSGKSYADYASVDIVSRVMEITGGKGCKLIIDGIGKDTSEISLKCLAKRGLFVSFGNASGAVPAFPVLRLLPQSAFLTRPKLNDYIATREELLDRAHDVFTWVREGKLNIKIDKVFDLDQVQTAHSYLESGQAKGKVLLKL